MIIGTEETIKEIERIEKSMKKGCIDHDHDFENAIRKGRAYYVCPKCGMDITLYLVLMEQAKRSK